MGKGRAPLLPAVSPAPDNAPVRHGNDAADRHLAVVRRSLCKRERLAHHGNVVHTFSLSSSENPP